MKIFYHDHFVLPLPEGHHFPLSKYALLQQRIVEANVVPLENMLVGAPVSDEELTRAHTPEYVRRVQNGELTKQEIRRIGFP